MKLTENFTFEPIGIDGYENYKVFRNGKVINIKNGKIITPKVNKRNKYAYLFVCKNGKHKAFRFHRIIAELFIPNPECKPEVNHINGIKSDNRIENLEWCTSSENSLHAIRTGLQKKGDCSQMHTKESIKKMSNAKMLFNIDEASEIFEMKYALNVSNKHLSEIVGCSATVIDKLIRGDLKCRVA